MINIIMMRLKEINFWRDCDIDVMIDDDEINDDDVVCTRSWRDITIRDSKRHY
jgi:hypothetical protein